MADFTGKSQKPEQTGQNKLREHIFEKLFETAEIAKFTPAQIQSYEDSLKYYRDLKNSLDTAKEEGIEEGIVKGIEKEKVNVALKALKKGYLIEDIMELTGLSKAQLEGIEKAGRQ